MRSKPSSIRSKIVFALIVPVAALIALWGADVNASIDDAVALRNTYSTRDNVSQPSDRMVTALQSERSRSLEVLAEPDGEGAGLRGQRAATDAAITEFRTLSKRYEGRGVSADIARARIADMLKTLDSLTGLRTQIDARQISSTEALSGYSSIIGYAFSVSAAAAASSEPLVERVMRTTVTMRSAGELLSQEEALLTGATTAGRFGAGEYLKLVQVVGALRFQIPTAGSTLPAPDQALYKGMLSGPSFSALRTTEDRILAAGATTATVSITLEQWKATVEPAARELYAFLADGYNHAVEFANAAGDRILRRFVITGGLGLAAILLSLFLTIQIGGSVVRRLSVLRSAATDLAHRRLPETVQRLRSGEKIDMDGAALHLSLGRDEIADVGAALAEVQRSAIESAAAEAALRYDMNKVLVNIARRNQSLIDRQLEALAQPDGPARAEQLAVQMRRHAEHLVILSGSARSRRGLGPEGLAGIIRRAAGEVEHAERIEFGAVADVEVPEQAVSDAGHLLAELLDNATTFSPPDTAVRVSARIDPAGVVVEIEDHGLGMSPSALDETNRRLAQPQDFDPAGSARLGLFVVAVLAAQCGIQVVLRSSGQGGGVTAVVAIPADLAVPVAVRPAAGAHRADASRLVGMSAGTGRRTTL